MWLSFDTCSSYAWSKILKRGYPLGVVSIGQCWAVRIQGGREQQQVT